MVSIVGDIGGTKALLGILTDDDRIVSHTTYLVENFASFREVLVKFIEEKANGTPISASAIAAAGPAQIENGLIRIAFSNSPWFCDQGEISAITGSEETHLINDFEGASLGVPGAVKNNKVRYIQNGIPELNQHAILLGPGTGFGKGRLDFLTETAKALPTEGGHAPIAPVTSTQAKILAAAKEILFPCKDYEPFIFSNNLMDYITQEGLFSFKFGLPAQEIALRHIYGQNVTANDRLDPEEITRRAQRNQPEDKFCVAAVREFCHGLGAIGAADALNPRTGFIAFTSDLTTKLGPAFNEEALQQGLKCTGKWDAIIKNCSVGLLTEPTALEGCKFYLRQHENASGPSGVY